MRIFTWNIFIAVAPYLSGKKTLNKWKFQLNLRALFYNYDSNYCHSSFPVYLHFERYLFSSMMKLIINWISHQDRLKQYYLIDNLSNYLLHPITQVNWFCISVNWVVNIIFIKLNSFISLCRRLVQRFEREWVSECKT